jgi:NIMA (never in mitosis gene a)-related kinase
MVKEIGSGSFGRAYLVQINPQAPKANGKDKQLVLKEIDLSGQNAQQRAAAEVEVKVLSSLKHPYIVKYWESFTSREKLCIVMDYCEGGDLWQYIAACKKKRTTIPETHVVRWFTQMCLALKYIHEKNVLHRDLKTQNVFLTRKDSSEMRCAKIADFGIAKVLKDQHSMAKTLVGTPYYLSPEICQKQPYACPSDVWAVGCMLFELCALRVPFDAKDLNQLVDRIVRSTLPRIPASYSRELGDLGAELLTRDARQRPSAGTILQRPIIQTEIKRMLAENKGSQPAGGTSNEAEQVMPLPMSAREPRAPSLSARESREPRASSRELRRLLFSGAPWCLT